MRVLKDTFDIQTDLVHNNNEGSVVYKLNAIPTVGYFKLIAQFHLAGKKQRKKSKNQKKKHKSKIKKKAKSKNKK